MTQICKIKYEDWDKSYKPLKDAKGSPKKFYYEDLAYLKSQDPLKVWSFIDVASCKTFEEDTNSFKVSVINGLYTENVICYFLTEVRFDPNPNRVIQIKLL